jgi:hypothetical protein
MSTISAPRLSLRFFDLQANIYSDSSAYVDLFARIYGRFRANGAAAPRGNPVNLALLTRPDNPWGRPALILDGDVWPLTDPNLLAGYIYQIMLNAMAARVRSHVLIHAGAVAWAGQGIVLAADTRHGKTTLVLELVRRGFKFLSDEVAALGRADRRLHPFPRSLRIRPGSLSLAGFSEPGPEAPTWLGKLLLDIEQIQPNSLGRVVPIRHVIILQDPAAAGNRAPGQPRQELGVLVNRLDGPLLDAVRKIKAVTEVYPDVHQGYPLLRLRTARRMSALAQIEALCRERRILIMDVVSGPTKQPTFSAAARLEAIPASQTILELIPRFYGGHKSALLQEDFGGSTTRLYIHLADIIGRAKCYQLSVGPLPEMADLVCELAGAPKARET